MTTKITVELTVEQAYTMMEALELFSRIQMGQFDAIAYTMHMNTYNKSLKNNPDFDRQMAQAYLDAARAVIFPQLERSAYIGIMQTSERSKISWDIYQQLRFMLSGDPMKTPFKTSQQPPPQVTVTVAEENSNE